MKKYGVVIGRFQPFHLGHMSLVEQALHENHHVVIALGSSNTAPNTKNPFSPFLRQGMLRACFSKDQNERIKFVEVADYLYSDEKWVTETNNKVHAAIGYDDVVTLYGFHKDSSSFYLDLFPGWKFVHVSPKHDIDATAIRRLWFEDKGFAQLVPTGIANILDEYKKQEIFKDLKEEYSYLKTYKASFASQIFPPVFTTVDAVVIQTNHVLVIKRKDSPGKGLYALPGGFIQQEETLVSGMLRELVEETKIVLPKEELRAAIVDNKVFDSPYRSLRGRVITHAYCLKLNNKVVPRVTGSDDASHAEWISINDVYKNDSKFFEDHLQIIDWFVSKI